MAPHRIFSALLVFLVSSCTPASEATGPFRPSVPFGTVPEVPSTPFPQQSPLDRYRLFHATAENALATDDPSHIGDVATGPIAAHLREVIAAQRRAGVVRRGHAALAPRLVSVRDGTALIVDCVVTGGLWTYRIDTGARVGPAPAELRTRYAARLVLRDGTWKVDLTTIPEESAC